MQNSQTIDLRVREHCPHHAKFPVGMQEEGVELLFDLLHPLNLLGSSHQDLPMGLSQP